MRAFIALELPDVFKGDVARLARILALHVEGRFIDPENYHLTLAFLGNCAQDDIARATDALEAACSCAHPIPLQSCGLGTFGKKGDCTLWLDIEQTPELCELARFVREALSTRDVDFDPKPCKAHITLARRAHIPSKTLPDLPFPLPEQAETITLFKSTLDPNGAVYKPLSSAQLE